MNLNNIFVLKRTIEVHGRSEAIIQRLNSQSCMGFGSFTNHSFKFIMIGKVGIHRMRESCYISGSIRNITNGCIVCYAIYPGIIFWICSTANFLFILGNFISVLTSKDSISNFFFKLLIINSMLLFVETMETRNQEKWCNEKIEKIVYGHSAEAVV